MGATLICLTGMERVWHKMTNEYKNKGEFLVCWGVWVAEVVYK